MLFILDSFHFHMKHNPGYNKYAIKSDKNWEKKYYGDINILHNGENKVISSNVQYSKIYVIKDVLSYMCEFMPCDIIRNQMRSNIIGTFIESKFFEDHETIIISIDYTDDMYYFSSFEVKNITNERNIVKKLDKLN